MRNLNSINKDVLLVFIIVIIIELSIICYNEKKDSSNPAHEIHNAEYKKISDIVDVKLKDLKKADSNKMAKSMIIGIIKGGLTGAIIGGYESILTGGMVMFVLQGLYVSLENM